MSLEFVAWQSVRSKARGTIPAVQGVCGQGGDTSPSALSPSVNRCLCLPGILACFALTPQGGPIVVTHLGASPSSFKESRGESEATACHPAPSELAINTIACPQGPEKATGGGSVGGDAASTSMAPSRLHP